MLRLSVLFILILFTISQCAVPAPPIGGPADTQPPVLDTLKSTSNYLTDIALRKIVLEFDEYIQVKNISKELIVSPPLKYGPNVETDGKKVIFELDEREVLADSTTYVIQFGESIQDFREGNPYKNYTHIFSTGPILDSGIIQGKLNNYATGEPIEDALVALYENNLDTMPISAKPMYYTRSDKDGSYRLDFLRERKYALFAIADLNRNIQYDIGIGESIGFNDSLFSVKQDSTIHRDFTLITPALALAVTEISGTDGYLKINTSRDIDSLLFDFSPTVENLIEINALTEKPLDYREYYFTNTPDKIISTYPDGTSDTTSAPKGIRPPLSLTDPANGEPSSINIIKELKLSWSLPIDSVFIDQFSIEDSTGQSTVLSYSIDTIDPRTIKIGINDDREGNQSIRIASGAIKDIYGKTNKDTLIVNYTRTLPSDLGQLNLSISGLDSSRHYMAFLKQDERLIQQWRIRDKTEENKRIERLSPADYSLVLIEDRNKNNRWDPGTFPGRLTPEKRESFNLETIRADWDVDSKVIWE